MKRFVLLLCIILLMLCLTACKRGDFSDSQDEEKSPTSSVAVGGVQSEFGEIPDDESGDETDKASVAKSVDESDNDSSEVYVAKSTDEPGSELNKASVTNSADESGAQPNNYLTVRLEQESDTYRSLLLQFCNDASIPESVRNQFALAVRGDEEAQNWIYQYTYQHDDLTWTITNIVYNYDSAIDENVCLFNIAMLYYNGNDYIGFLQDRAKAFEWAKLSADMGNADAALCIGDMARYGNGVTVNVNMAFSYYLASQSIATDGIILDRLGDCYAYGIGTVPDRKKAFDYYLDSASMGYSEGMYKLSDFTEHSEINMTALYKAASSMNYSGDYWDMVYGGLEGYSADNSKRDLVEKLSDIWENGNDIAAVKLQSALRSDKYFSNEFVKALTRTVYSYSYHLFAENYGLQPNRTHEDGMVISFAPNDTSELEFDYNVSMAEKYLEYDTCQFYEYDFDGDGVNEIGIPMHSGAGGAFMADRFAVFQKNADGFYTYYAEGPDCTLRDAMRIIQYNGRIYFIVNPFDDTRNAPHNIIAYTIDVNGKGRELSIICKDYDLQNIITYTDDVYSDEYYVLFSEVEQQIHDAVVAVKQQQLYSPDSEKHLAYDDNNDWWSNRSGENFGEITRQDVFFAADIYNSGFEKVIHKGRLITQSKYYDDYYWFQVYEDLDFEVDLTPIISPKFYGEYYGQHSSGNIYDVLPLEGGIVQFWAHEYNGTTLCLALQRYGLLYVLQIFEVRNGEVNLVSKSLYFDEVQGIEIVISS